MVTVYLRDANNPMAQFEDDTYYCVVNGKYVSNRGNAIQIEMLNQQTTKIKQKNGLNHGEFKFVPGCDSYECFIEEPVAEEPKPTPKKHWLLVVTFIVVILLALWLVL